MQNRHLTIVAPNIFSTCSQHAESMPALQTLLARGRRNFCLLDSAERLLFSLFGIKLEGELPTAAVTGLADGLNTHQHYWLRADPVELRADLAAVYFIGTKHLMFAAAALNELTNHLQTLLALDGLHLYAPHAHRWYLAMKQDPEIITALPEYVMGKDISNFLPKGKRATYWCKLLTELQMLLYQADHISGVNGVWLWGGGALPAASSRIWNYIGASDPLTKGLSLLTKQIVLQSPASFEEYQIGSSLAGEHLLVFLEEKTPVEWEALWFSPLLTSLKRGEFATIGLYPHPSVCYQLTPWTSRYFWKRWRGWQHELSGINVL